MEIRCSCGNPFFTKQMRLKILLGQDGIHEETYYTCSRHGCGITVAKKDVRNFPMIDDVVYITREID